MYKSPIQQQFELARKQSLIKQGLLDEYGNQPTNPYLQELAQLNEKPSIFSHRNDDINAPAIDHAEPLWENVWFENECACIFGDPNIGKSTLAFQIACNVADSGRNVIYFDFENMMHQYHSRSWAPEQFIKPDNLLIDHFAQDTTFEQMTDRRLILDHIEQEFLKLSAPVIIIDDITQICPMRNNRKTHRVLRRLRQWLNQYHVSILVIAHASHHHEGTPLAMKHLTGDRQLAYAFDSIVSLNDIPAGTTADGATHYIKQLKARNAPIQIHNEAVTTLKLKDRFDDEACQLLAKKFHDKGYDQETIQQQLEQQRDRKFFYFLTIQEKASENQLLFLPLDATPEQRLTFIHDTFAKGWSIRTIAAHCCTPKTTVHRLLATPKPSFNSPSKIEGDTGGVCQEEKGNTSPSKIDLDDTIISSPSKIEGARGSMNTSPSKIDLDDTVTNSPSKIEGVPQRGGGVCPTELNAPEQCNNNSCSGSNEVVNEQLTEICVKKGEKVHVLGDKVADKKPPSSSSVKNNETVPKTKTPKNNPPSHTTLHSHDSAESTDSMFLSIPCFKIPA